MSRQRSILLVVSVIILAASWALLVALAFGSFESSPDCPAEDMLVVKVAEGGFDWSEGDTACVHVDDLYEVADAA